MLASTVWKMWWRTCRQHRRQSPWHLRHIVLGFCSSGLVSTWWCIDAFRDASWCNLSSAIVGGCTQVVPRAALSFRSKLVDCKLVLFGKKMEEVRRQKQAPIHSRWHASHLYKITIPKQSKRYEGPKGSEFWMHHARPTASPVPPDREVCGRWWQ